MKDVSISWNKKRTGQFTLGFGALLLTASLSASGYSGIILAGVGLFTALISLSQVVSHIDEERYKIAVESTLSQLNKIQSGRLYTGRNSEVLVTKRACPSGGNAASVVEQLCKTASGNWFLLRFSRKSLSVTIENVELIPYETAEAKQWLQDDPDTYVKVFGPPEFA